MVTVIDNGSKDGSIAAVKQRHPEVRLLPLGENRGFTGGLAAGLARCTARNVIFLNNDAVPEPGWLAAMLRAIDEAPDDVVSVGGKIVGLDGQTIDFIEGLLTFDGHAFQRGFRYPLGSQPEPPAGGEILFACGGNMISRRETLTTLGGFDDDYFAYLEDVDFGWRTWLSGRRAIFEPRAVVRHASSATSKRLGDFERGILFERNALQTSLKNFENFQEAAGAIFYSYLHRLHHFATTRNEGTSELRRAPFTARASRKPGLFGRARMKLFGSLFGNRPLATIDDPLTTMQFRALEWIVANGDRVAKKREAVQAMRKRSDREIFGRFPLHVIPTYPGDEAMMSGALFRLLAPHLPLVEKSLAEVMKT